MRIVGQRLTHGIHIDTLVHVSTIGRIEIEDIVMPRRRRGSGKVILVEPAPIEIKHREGTRSTIIRGNGEGPRLASRAIAIIQAHMVIVTKSIDPKPEGQG